MLYLSNLTAAASAVIPGLLASAGGGGSGGGGGGGGSGSSGGTAFALVCYMPMHAIGAYLRRHYRRGSVSKPALWSQAVGWIIALAYSVFWIRIPGMGSFLIFAIPLTLTGMAAGLYNWGTKVTQSKYVKKVLAKARRADPTWDEAHLIEHARSVFMRYQADWSTLKTSAMHSYMTPQYYYHASLLMHILYLAGRRNSMEDVVIQKATITAAEDAADNQHDNFTVAFTAKAKDSLVRTADGSAIFTHTGSFAESWHFQRSGSTWLLGGITPSTASSAYSNPQMSQFATSHGYCYSPDMGWLFLPERGQLFDSAKFGTSDINNHVVGLYKDRLLIQLYTYIPNPAGTRASQSYVIAQANLPKSYGEIVVRRKRRLQPFGIKGLERVQTEWIKFNGKYEVFASDGEQATSFELLNPTYMEKLAALPFEVNIEVVDNVVYLYSDQAKTDATSYDTVLGLLNAAFDEMKL